MPKSKRFDIGSIGLSLFGVIGLAAAWWGLHDSSHAQSQISQLESRIDAQRSTISLQEDTIKQYQRNFKIMEAEFYSDNLTLVVSRDIAQTYKNDRDLNWSRYQHYQDLYDQCRARP